ncbi:HK97-gp10 family putative phage morphogenesis protein [Micromonospora sp. NPDC000207]|uniref:HK97-gp10 family putative phage morphogenesis protein n=1 Tax=Micromonospora sp. NPDC000207 TaxID=3154246 RepID=UPI00331FCE56
MVEVDKKPIRPQVLAALSQVPEVARQVRTVANAIRRDARALAPKDTKNLSRNLQVERVYDSATGSVHFIVGWGPAGWYGWMVESGSEDHSPQPHLVPAAIKNGAVAGGEQ